jgi:hypothetical protein
MENIEVKLESIDPTGVAIETKTIHMPIYDEESMVKRRLILHIGECLYSVDTKGYIIERLVPHHTNG